MGDIRFILEVENYCDFFEYTRVINSIPGVITEHSNVEILEEGEGNITIKDKNKHIILYYRDKSEGGRLGKELNHGNSIKIEEPKRFRDIEILVPAPDYNGKIEIKNGKKEVSDKAVLRELSPAIKFIEDNAKYFNAFFRAKYDTQKERAVKQIASHNDNIEDMNIKDTKNTVKVNAYIAKKINKEK